MLWFYEGNMVFFRIRYPKHTCSINKIVANPKCYLDAYSLYIHTFLALLLS